MGPWKLHFLLEEILVPVQFNHSRTLLMEWEPKQWVKREISSLAPLCDFFFFSRWYISLIPQFLFRRCSSFSSAMDLVLSSLLSQHNYLLLIKRTKKKVEESNKKKESPSLSLSLNRNEQINHFRNQPETKKKKRIFLTLTTHKIKRNQRTKKKRISTA